MTEQPTRRLLDNGIPMVTESLPHLRSVSLGVWVETGSRDERDDEQGISHFLEHTFFKGTRSRTAEAIAREMDALGGEMNASTGREDTAFYTQVLSDRLVDAVDLIADLLNHATFPEEELARERGVIIEEIRMVEDDPEEWIHDLHALHVWGADSPLGRPILGTEASVSSFDSDAIYRYLERRYTADRMVISAAGKLDAEELYEMLNCGFGQLPVGPANDVRPPAPEFTPAGVQIHQRSLEQVQLCMAGRGLPQNHSDRFGLVVLNNLLGGGSSSRLFQEVREKRGLAYSIYSGRATYRDCGELYIHAGCAPEAAIQVTDLIAAELDKLMQTTVGADEVERVKGNLKSAMVLGLESSFSRMSRLAEDEQIRHAHQPLDQMLDEIDRVDAAQLQRLAQHSFAPSHRSVTALGAVPTGFAAHLSATTPAASPAT